MKIEFLTSQYQFCHGRKPRGKGFWVFKAGEQLINVPGSRSYTEAKKIIISQFKAVFKGGSAQVTVMP